MARLKGLLLKFSILSVSAALFSGPFVFGETLTPTATPELLKITWNLYSGRESPAWTISDPAKIAKIEELLSGLQKMAPAAGWSPAWGGFSFSIKRKTVNVKNGVIQIAEGRAAGTNDFFKDSLGLEELLLLEAKERKLGPFAVPAENLPENFLINFYRLFLSNDEFCLKANGEFLSTVQPGRLSAEERGLVSQKLEEFLLESQWRNFYNSRDFDRCGPPTGVASEMAFLRLDVINLLGQVGNQADIAFIEKLNKSGPFNHPLFAGECEKAVKSILERENKRGKD